MNCTASVGPPGHKGEKGEAGQPGLHGKNGTQGPEGLPGWMFCLLALHPTTRIASQMTVIQQVEKESQVIPALKDVLVQQDNLVILALERKANREMLAYEA